MKYLMKELSVLNDRLIVGGILCDVAKVFDYVHITFLWNKYQGYEWIKSHEAYSESKYRFAVKKSSKVSYKILFLTDSTFFKIFFHVFATIIEAFIVAGHKFFVPFS